MLGWRLRVLPLSFIFILHFSTAIYVLASAVERRLDELTPFNLSRMAFGEKTTQDPVYHKVHAIFEKCRSNPCRRGFICGNKQFYNLSPHHATRMNWILQHTQNSIQPESSDELTKISCTFQEKPVTIMVVSSWISDQPLDVQKLNHYQYCKVHNYPYSHQSLTKEQYANLRRPQKFPKEVAKHLKFPPGWSTVEYVSELMRKYPKVDYFVKLDLDCLFTRADVLLETVLDPFEQYSFYVTQIEESRFIQSHTWIVKNDNYGRNLIKRWLDFRFKTYCVDLAQEQGALNLLIGRLMKEAHQDRTTAYNCDNECNRRKSVYHHHHCVLDWYAENNMSVAGEWMHPKIYLYPYFESRKTLISPDDGFNAQFNQNSGLSADTFRPLTLHACKADPYVSAETLLMDYKSYCN
eukprot:gene11301-12312_t